MNTQESFIGKRVGPNLYLHTSALDDAASDLQDRVRQAAQLTTLEPGKDFNVVKAHDNGNDISLLDYPDFFQEAFPILSRYWSCDLAKETFRFRTYRESFNPPVLHRKELLLPFNDPARPRFAELTQQAESIGLFDQKSRIGFLQEWKALLRQRGYRVQDHELVPVGNEETFELAAEDDTAGGVIKRHLTALSRANLSAPMQTLGRFGYLDGTKTVFDYGCGRGSDVAFLAESGVLACGWDPYYAAEFEKQSADIVNLGFVINVIEDPSERSDALHGAFGLANEWLVVSAMLEHSNTGNGKPYADGVLTSRNTFQKYYSQPQLAHYIHEVLGIEPLPVAPGIFYVFKDKDAEQRFSTQRVAKRRSPIKRQLRRLTQEEQAERITRQTQQKFDANSDLLEALWTKWLELGREPKPKEVSSLETLRQRVGSYPAALKLILEQKEPDAATQIQNAAETRVGDLSVYFAQLRFSQKRPPRPIEPSLKEDIKHFFGNQENAMAQGEELLLSILDKQKINAACESAAQEGVGWLFEGHSLQLHTSLVSQLPPILRTYIHCATSLYGDITSADLVKVHIRSGKLTLMNFDNFEGNPVPRMLERIKINLLNQRLDFFDYGEEYEPPNLYLKSRYMNEDQEGYSDQAAFDEQLQSLIPGELEGFGPSPAEFEKMLQSRRLAINGFSIVFSQTIPNLDAPCGANFRYRDLIQCGETQASSDIPNLPKQPDTYTAILRLARELLDPIIDYFGMIKLTYGFCSSELAKKIPGRIAPKLDQHAGHELNRLGNPICDRGGAAVDFLVEDEDMLEVCQWICGNLEFDRIYFYGPQSPLHLSFSACPNKQVTLMKSTIASSRLMPKTYSYDQFLSLPANKQLR